MRNAGRVRQRFEDRGENSVITAWPSYKHDTGMESSKDNNRYLWLAHLTQICSSLALCLETAQGNSQVRMVIGLRDSKAIVGPPSNTGEPRTLNSLGRWLSVCPSEPYSSTIELCWGPSSDFSKAHFYLYITYWGHSQLKKVPYQRECLFVCFCFENNGLKEEVLKSQESKGWKRAKSEARNGTESAWVE